MGNLCLVALVIGLILGAAIVYSIVSMKMSSVTKEDAESLRLQKEAEDLEKGFR